jgi:hypothetical protein
VTRLEGRAVLLSAIAQAKLAEFGERKECSFCTRWLPVDEFHPGRRLCKACHSDNVRAAQLARAAT